MNTNEFVNLSNNILTYNIIVLRIYLWFDKQMLLLKLVNNN